MSLKGLVVRVVEGVAAKNPGVFMKVFTSGALNAPF
jgi:hypothetical protein